MLFRGRDVLCSFGAKNRWARERGRTRDPMAASRKYIIFGGTGFLGSHIAEALLERRKGVVFVYDLVGPEEGEKVEGVEEYFLGDIVDEDRVVNVLQQVWIYRS